MDSFREPEARDYRRVKESVRRNSWMKTSQSATLQETGGGQPAKPTAWQPRFLLWLYVALAGSLLLRISVLDFESGDYTGPLSTWYDYLVEHGRWAALKDDFSCYPPLFLSMLSLSTLLPLPKLYAVKGLSILCDYAAGWLVYKIVRRKHPAGPLPIVAFVLFLFLPTVWFNSAVWGQCDVMFTGALLATVYWIMCGRPVAALAAYGVAWALKPQAIFLAPFLAGLLFRGRIGWNLVLLPAGVYGLCGLPEMLAGKPILDVLFHWGRYRVFSGLVLGATNWYQWVSDDQVFFLPGLVLASSASAFLILGMRERSDLEPMGWTITTALLSALLAPYFLPGVHERYFYAADVLSLVYAFFIPRGWIVTCLVQAASFFTYLPYLFHKESVPRPLLAVVMTVAFVVTVFRFSRSLPVLGSQEDRTAP